jgi:hypothetical protein
MASKSIKVVFLPKWGEKQPVSQKKEVQSKKSKQEKSATRLAQALWENLRKNTASEKVMFPEYRGR